MSFGVILGLVAGAITTFSLIPQVVRVFKLKEAHEISLYFTILFIIGDSIWLYYGVYFKLLPVIFWNAIAVVLAIALLIGKLKFDRKYLMRRKMPKAKQTVC